MLFLEFKGEDGLDCAISSTEKRRMRSTKKSCASFASLQAHLRTTASLGGVRCVYDESHQMTNVNVNHPHMEPDV